MQGTFKERVAQVVSGEYKNFDTVPVCVTPQLIRDIGFSDGEIVMTQKHIRNCLAQEETATDKEHHHNLPIDFMDSLPQYIESPAMVLSSLTQKDSIVLVTDCKDKKDRPIIVALKNNGIGRSNGRLISCNVLTSTYGKDSFESFINNSIKQNGVLYYDNKKSRNLVVSAGFQLPRVLAKYDSNIIIRRFDEIVNPLSENNLDFSPDGYGTTLERPDGKPFAYADSDGRQKTYEYSKAEDGKEYLSKTTATFSDGRSEITDYGENGAVLGIERKDAEGRTTYKYSSDGIGYHAHEASYEYYDGLSEYWDKYADRSEELYKSVHEKTRDKVEERGYYHDTAKEGWRESDERGNITLSRYNVYGVNDAVQYTSEIRYGYDRYNNTVSEIDSDGGVYKTEYYSPSEVRDYFCYDSEDYEAGARDYDSVKSKVSRYPDGRISVKSYSLDGKETQLDYSADGNIEHYRDTAGNSHYGFSAQAAYVKSAVGAPPTFAEVAAASKAARPTTLINSTKKNDGKPTGNGAGNHGR